MPDEHPKDIKDIKGNTLPDGAVLAADGIFH